MLNEVAPPGFGHTKGDKKKGVKRGGTAAAFDRARKEGRFKGSKSDMFAIMWSQKNKGDKPHYKPGTNKKYKKYQEDWKPEIEHIKGSDLRKKAAEKKRKEAADSLPPHLKLDAMKKAFAHTNESLGFTIDSGEHKKASKKAKLRNLAKGNTNPNEKAAAEKKAGGPKLMGEGRKWDSYKKAVATVLGKKKEQRTAQKAMDAGARLRRKKQRQEYASKVSGSEDIVPDDIRD